MNDWQLKKLLTIWEISPFQYLRNWDQYQYLGNCPPTPPLTQQQSIDNKLVLMFG